VAQWYMRIRVVGTDEALGESSSVAAEGPCTTPDMVAQ
jgi:hypothetical protein